MVKVWTSRSQKSTSHGQDATGTQQEGDVHAQQVGIARGQRARAANKGKGVAHRLVADAWLAEEQYAHAKEQHEELGPVFK